MKKENLFYLIIILTVLILRLIVFIYPKHLIISGLVIHHFWIGVLLILVSILFLRKYKNLKLLAFGIGLGLFIDELGFMIMGWGDFPQYWALPSIISAVVLLIIAYIFKRKIYEITR